MSFKRLSLLFAAMVFIAATAAASQSARAAAGNTILQMMPGNWNCSSTGSNGKRAATYTFTSVNPDLVRYTFDGKLRPVHGAGIMYYDSKKQSFAWMGASNGWGVSEATAAPSASTITLTDTYPADPTNSTAVYHFSKGKITYTSHWKKSGKAMSQTGTCTKS